MKKYEVRSEQVSWRNICNWNYIYLKWKGLGENETITEIKSYGIYSNWYEFDWQNYISICWTNKIIIIIIILLTIILIIAIAT